MNKFGTHHYRLQVGGIRYVTRQPPLWMKMNMWEGKCWCGKSFEWPKRKYCCWEHSQLWFFQIRCYWEGFRCEVLRQEHYKCSECGIQKKGDTAFFDVDHIIAISLGGECFDRENVRTLCQDCHKIKTKEDMKKLSFHRKAKGYQPLEVFG